MLRVSRAALVTYRRTGYQKSHAGILQLLISSPRVDPVMVSRRDFFAGLAATAVAAQRALATAPVVDAHMHVWSADTRQFPFAHPYDSNFKPPPTAGTMEMLLEEMN